MLKLLLRLILVILLVVCGASVYLKVWETKPEIILENRSVLLLKTSPLSSNAPIPPVITEINTKNKRIKSLSCDDIDIKLWQQKTKLWVTGQIYYEKPSRFRFQINSFFGKEADIGSNDTMFWYWSRRDANPGLYWAEHQDFNKTRLKTPFNPKFLYSSFGLDEINLQNAQIIENLNDLAIVYQQVDANNSPVRFSIIVSKVRKRIEGVSVADMNGKLLAVCEIQEFVADLPAKILYNWYEEDRMMLLKLNRVNINNQIATSKWTLPNHQPKKNMVDQ